MYALNSYLLSSPFCLLLSIYAVFYILYSYMHYVRAQLQIASAHVHIDACVYSFDKWPLDTVWTRRRRTFLFVAQFSVIDILSGVPVSSNCVVVSAPLCHGLVAKEKTWAVHCLPPNMIPLLILIFFKNLLTYSVVSIF